MEKDVRAVVWANVLAHMEEKKLNRWQIAQKAKLGIASITRMEAQDRDQSLSVFERVADLFEIPLWQLFKPAEAGRTAEALEAAELFDACPDEDMRAKALAIARLVLTGQKPAETERAQETATPVEQSEPAPVSPPAAPMREHMIRS